MVNGEWCFVEHVRPCKHGTSLKHNGVT